MQPKVLKYLLDIESIIIEVESVKAKTLNNFLLFQSDMLLQRATERHLEIIGEAVRKLTEIDPDINLSSIRKIIGLRNIISHAYDTVEAEILWGIIQKDIPVLSKEISSIRAVKN